MEMPAESYGINGLGQIGMKALELNLKRKPTDRLPITVINEWEDPSKVLGDLPGILPRGSEIRIIDGHVKLSLPGEQEILLKVVQWRDKDQYRWGDLGVTSVIDASRNPEATADGHIKAGVHEVLLTGPSAEFPELIRGINEEVISRTTNVYSNASCTTKAAAPVLKAIFRPEARGDLPRVIDIFLSGTHAATNTDSTVDRLGVPGVIDNIVGAKTGAAKALPRVFCIQEAGKVQGSVDRVPVTEGSRLNIHVTFSDDIARDRKAARGKILGLLQRLEEKDPTIFGIDDRKEPDVRSQRDDLRPSVLLSSLLQVGLRSLVAPIRYMNVAASANEALLTIKLIREIRARMREADRELRASGS